MDKPDNSLSILFLNCQYDYSNNLTVINIVLINIVLIDFVSLALRIN